MARFSDALDRNLEDIKRPPPLPVGHYLFAISKVPDAPREIEGKPYEILTINCTVVEPLDDVDPDDLEAFGKVAGTPSKIDFIFNTDPDEEQKFEGTLNRLKEFCQKCGVEDAANVQQMLAMLPSTRFMGEIKHRIDPNDDSIVYAEIGRTAAE